MLNAAFEKLAAYKKIAVWVLKGNERAIKFYERYGFRFDGTEQEIMLGTPNKELRMMYMGTLKNKTLYSMLEALSDEYWTDETILIRPIQDDNDLWFATVECKMKPGQEEFVNPAGFSIGRAYLAPDDNYPCIICKSDGTKIGYIIFRKWYDKSISAASWSYFLDAEYQGFGLGRRAAMLAVNILKYAGFEKIRLSTEADNVKAQRLYESVGFQRLDEKDGDDLVFGM